MNDANSLAGLLIGAYLLRAGFTGHGADLIALGSRDRAFLKWGIALVILMQIRDSQTFGKIGNELIVAAFIGFFLINIANISSQLETVWKALSAPVALPDSTGYTSPKASNF